VKIEAFFHDPTSTVSYLVHDATSGVVIDPVRDYDPKSGRTSWTCAEKIAAYIARQRLAIRYAIDTHAHADHMTGLPFFKERFGALSVTGAGIGSIQATFRDLYNLPRDFPVDGRQFDVLVGDGKRLGFGTLEIEAMHTPGHTPAHDAWRIGDALFLGDTLFMPDYGSARCDFPGGSAAVLFDSIQRIYALPEETRLFVGHDYQPDGRPFAFESSVAEQKRANVQISARTTKAEFVAFREKRDASLGAPALILPSLQVNIRAGELPEAEPNGTAYLKIPLNRLGGGANR
jgi:glyoxylase-like metal-dependent hydrolase (beta-lactamase superfamily II)